MEDLFYIVCKRCNKYFICPRICEHNNTKSHSCICDDCTTINAVCNTKPMSDELTIAISL